MNENLLKMIRPQLDAIHDVYKAAYEEGRRSAFAEMLPEITHLQGQLSAMGVTETTFKNECANT